MTTNEKIGNIRESMIKDKIDAFIIPSGDPHMSEYFSNHWKTREFISGFTGSVGTLVITQNESGLWVDGRYYVQAEKELLGSEIKLFYAAEPDCPTYHRYLSDVLKEQSVVGLNGRLFSYETICNIEKDFEEKKIKIDDRLDYANDIWSNRPHENYSQVFYLDEVYSGKNPKEKVNFLMNELDILKSDAIIISKLDNISWLFNIRALDIENNAVVISYAFVSKDEVVLFTEPSRINDEVKDKLSSYDIIIKDYEDIFSYLTSVKNLKVLLDKNEINYALYKSLEKNKNITLTLETSPIPFMKSCKNEVEIKNIYEAYIKDGCAMVEFYAWLFDALEKGEKITEYDTVLKLEYFRSREENYFCNSFASIMAYKANAAMMHYRPEKDKSSLLESSHLFLNDSGGQYLDGTTDTTRTFALGSITEEEKRDFTNVVKGVIALSTVIFKDGCTGSDLDILARQYIWNCGIDYRCGTGHGVGFMLNVHEGPPNFRDRNIKLKVGMNITIEPGVYTKDSHGIRTENTVCVVPHMKTEYGEFYRFETFTLVPIDLDCLDVLLLTDKEISWINDYHKKVYESLYPLLTEKAKLWLKNKTKEISK